MICSSVFSDSDIKSGMKKVYFIGLFFWILWLGLAFNVSSQNSVTGHACAEIVDLVSVKGTAVPELLVSKSNAQHDFLLGAFIISGTNGCTANTLICQVEPAPNASSFVPLLPVTFWEQPEGNDVASAESMVKVFSKLPDGLAMNTQTLYQSSYQIMIIYN